MNIDEFEITEKILFEMMDITPEAVTKTIFPDNNQLDIKIKTKVHDLQLMNFIIESTKKQILEIRLRNQEEEKKK